MKMKSMVHIYTISDLLFLIGDFEVAPLEKHVYSANPVKMTNGPILAVFPMVTSSQSNGATEFQAQIKYPANANFWLPFHKNI